MLHLILQIHHPNKETRHSKHQERQHWFTQFCREAIYALLGEFLQAYIYCGGISKMTNISYEYKVATLCGVDGSWRLNKPSSLGVAS